MEERKATAAECTIFITSSRPITGNLYETKEVFAIAGQEGKLFQPGDDTGFIRTHPEDSTKLSIKFRSPSLLEKRKRSTMAALSKGSRCRRQWQSDRLVQIELRCNLATLGLGDQSFRLRRRMGMTRVLHRACLIQCRPRLGIRIRLKKQLHAGLPDRQPRELLGEHQEGGTRWAEHLCPHRG